jgi:hypothetical protein
MVVALESLGIVAAVDTAQARALYDGPRNNVTDATDTTAFWLDRYGAPRKIQDALGHVTLLRRGDATYPALVTEMQEPNGLVSHAWYGVRGNLDSITVRNPYGDGRNATTRYQYTNPSWPDFATRVELPEGEVSSIGYDDAGNQVWQQPGERHSVSARRVTFHYHPNGVFRGMLHRVESPSPTGTGTAFETVTYDTIRGNLESVTTARGYTTTFETDALGRFTRYRAPEVMRS